MAFNLSNSLSIPEAVAGACSGAIAGVTAMFRLAKPVLAAALIALSGVPAFAADYVDRRSSKRRLQDTRRRLSAAGIFAATSTTTGRTSRRRLHHLRHDLLRRRSRQQQLRFRRPRRRLLARRRRRLPDHQLPAHRPHRRLLVRLGFQRPDHWDCGRRALRVDRHVVLQRLAAARQRLCRSRHLLRLHALCRRRYRRRACQLGRPPQHDRRRDHGPRRLRATGALPGR